MQRSMASNTYYQLNDFLETHTIDIPMFLSIAIEICKSVSAVHKQDKLVPYLSPHTILIDNTYAVQLSTDKAYYTFDSENMYYMAPEQFSNDEKETVQASDIYILGIIFYKMLLGKLPYATADIFTFSHNVLTQKVPLLSQEDENISPMISLIIQKMMAIHPSERYHDIVSVMIDLTKIQKSVEQEGKINSFTIDTFNNLRELYTKNTIYGREKEAVTLQYILDSKASSENRVMLVYGKSGIGKSALVDTIIEKNRNNFSHICSFKLDYSEENTPYQLLYSALSDMLRQIITEDDKTLQGYRRKLQNILGDDAYHLIPLIPEIAIILGEPFSKKNISDNVLNLDTILVRFMEIFIDAVKPLCIYVDDIQWADTVTLQWIKNVLFKFENIVFFLNYRGDDLEISSHEHFTAMLNDLSKNTIKVDRLKVSALSENDIDTLISESIDLLETKEVSYVIYARTKGNPFFVKQYLKLLDTEGVLWFDMELFKWRCDLERINSTQISDNVFDLLEKNIDSLPLDVQNLLCMASYIGNTFSYVLLKNVFDDDSIFDETLHLALCSGWIIHNSKYQQEKKYRFLHDQMQESLKHMIMGDESVKIHYKIGSELAHKREDIDRAYLLRCVNHLNIASIYVEDKALLAALNLEASAYAKKSADFKSALRYIKKSMELSLANSTAENSALLFRQRGECEHLCHHSDEAITYYEKALDQAQRQAEKAEIYELLIKLYSDISKFSQAYEVGKVALEGYGIKIPNKFVPPLFIAEFLRLKFKLRDYETQDLISLPVSENDDFKMTIRLLANTLQAAYQIQPELSVANALIMIRLCLENGLTREAVIGFTVFGVIFQGAILGRHTQGFNYSQLSFDMLRKFDNTVQQPEVQFVCGYFGSSWRLPAVASEETWYSAYINGLKIGDWFHTGCAAAAIVQSMFMRGVVFDDILKQIDSFDKVLRRIGAKEQHGAMMSVKQTLLNLREETGSPEVYDSEEFNEKEYVESLNSYESEHFAHYYFVNKMISHYMHKAHDKAHSVSLEGKKFMKSSKGMLHYTEHMFYDALILAQLYEDANFTLQVNYKRKIKRIKNKFIVWSEGCAENFLPRAHLLQAEMFRIKKNHGKAFWYYDKTIEVADIYGQKQLAAIANRLASELYTALGQHKAAKVYEAASLKRFHALGMKQDKALESVNSIHFDVHALIKASEVIAKEYEFSSLLKTLIQIIVENAAAQHGFLLLEKNGDFHIQASSNTMTGETTVLQNISYKESDAVEQPIVNYVLRSRESIVIHDMAQSDLFDRTAVSSREVKSLLCAPLMLQGELKGIIYLENNLLSGVFTENKVQLLQHLSGQIIISIENTVVYNDLEEKVKQRTLDLEVAKDELKLLASTDPLTKLYNRRYFSEVSENIFNLLKRERSTLSLMMLDVDNFKFVNDTYGHQAGDRVIITIANILLEFTRKSDVVCRFGGEEFIVLLPHTDEKSTLLIAENIRASIEKESIKIGENSTVSVTVSLGISNVDFTEDKDIEVAIRNADDALYAVKNSGKNSILLYT